MLTHLLTWLTPIRPFGLREAVVRVRLGSGEVLVFDHLRREVRVERPDGFRP